MTPVDSNQVIHWTHAITGDRGWKSWKWGVFTDQ